MLGAALVVGGCASHHTAAPSGSAAAPKVLTVEELTQMVEMATPPVTMYGEINRSGTVYRLTANQYADLQANGMPSGLISYMKLTYNGAVQKHPDLAKSDEKWTRIGDYWYGGLPFGWPRDWVGNAPAFGEVWR